MRTHPLVAAFIAESGNAVSTRMIARLTELAALLERLATGTGTARTPRLVDCFSLGDDEGLGAVQTARGLLLHRARVAGGRVHEYQIVAPTEWNFHPAGALARGLLGTEAGNEAALARDARLVVQALDPCVACRVEVLDA
jgi:coenzyme F420-reducing hydrogenase alpha subunit